MSRLLSAAPTARASSTHNTPALIPQHLAHEYNRESSLAWPALVLNAHLGDERELYWFSFANHAAAFFRKSRSIRSRRFSSRSSRSSARSSVSSGLSFSFPDFFAACTQFPSVPS